MSASEVRQYRNIQGSDSTGHRRSLFTLACPDGQNLLHIFAQVHRPLLNLIPGAL
jgi:hypothetical protein